MAESSTGTFRSAVAWSYVMDGGRQVLTSIITLVLAGTLGPEVFGTAAMALVFVMFVQMLQSQGLMPAIIQRRDLEREHLDSAFWAIVTLSLALTAACIAASGWWARVNDLPDLQQVIVALAALIPLQGLVIVQEAVVRRSMDFRVLALRTNVAVIAGGVVAVVLALQGAGVWALVVQQIVSSVVGVAMLWHLSGWRPGWRISRVALGELLSFASRSFASTVAVFVGNRADALLIGIFFGPVAVGIYRLAARLVESLTDLTVRAMQGAALPELSRHQSDPAAFRERTLSILATTSMFSLPVLALLAVVGPDVVALLGEEGWGPTADVIRILCIVGAVRSLSLFTGPMLQALGRPGLLAWMSWFTAVAGAGTFVAVGVALRDATISTQVMGIALSRALLHLPVLLVLYLWPAQALVGISVRSMSRAIAPGAIAAAGALVSGMAMTVAVADAIAPVRLAATGAVAGATAAGVLTVVAPTVRQGLRRHLAATPRLRPVGPR